MLDQSLTAVVNWFISQPCGKAWQREASQFMAAREGERRDSARKGHKRILKDKPLGFVSLPEAPPSRKPI